MACGRYPWWLKKAVTCWVLRSPRAKNRTAVASGSGVLRETDFRPATAALAIAPAHPAAAETAALPLVSSDSAGWDAFLIGTFLCSRFCRGVDFGRRAGS